MSINKISSKQWSLIGTSTPVSVTTVDFTNLPSVSKILLVLDKVDFSGTPAELVLRFNAVSTQNYQFYCISQTSDVRAVSASIRTFNTSGTPLSGFWEIEQVNSPIPSRVTGILQSGSTGNRNFGAFLLPQAITQLNLIFNQTIAAANTGTIQIFGVYE